MMQRCFTDFKTQQQTLVSVDITDEWTYVFAEEVY
jgi:hypothetical protein